MALLLGLVLAWACGGPQELAADGEVCYRDDDCEAGLVCVAAPGQLEDRRCTSDVSSLISMGVPPPMMAAGGSAQGGAPPVGGGGAPPGAAGMPDPATGGTGGTGGTVGTGGSGGTISDAGMPDAPGAGGA